MLKLKASNNITHKISAVIFDLDGTLVESSLNFRQIKTELNCPVDKDLLAYVETLPEAERVEANSYIESQEMLDAKVSRWLPWAKELVDNLHGLQLPMAIVTRNFSKATALKISNNGIPITKVITREDAPAKPDPTALLNIAESWSIAPGEILYVGDFLYDLQAATNAQMHSCLYSPDVMPEYASEASIAVKCFSELWAHLTYAH